MNSIYREIFDYVKSLEIIDTHEHLPTYEKSRDRDTDVLKEYLTHYFSRDLISAGLKQKDFDKVIDNRLPLMERWEIVEPYWEFARNTGYGRCLDISVKALYGIESINRSTIEQLNEAFIKTLSEAHYYKVLKEKSNIRVSILDKEIDCDRSFFRPVCHMDYFVNLKSLNEVSYVESETGIRICSMDDWLEAFEVMLEKAFSAGAVALKSTLAYERTLKYDRFNKSEAESEFNQIFKAKNKPDWGTRTVAVGKAFQDYMMHFILRAANRKNLTFQFHTGLQEGSGNVIGNSDPSLMSNLFLEYPDVDFDIFHIGYPYQQVLSALAKNFQNVYIDMCWAHIISPSASINALTEWFDSVPANKISAFGGDYCFVDAVYGHQYLARVNVSKALSAKVEDGVFDIERAKVIAKMLFYDNPLKIFKLEGKI